jgi:hypothetical protein
MQQGRGVRKGTHPAQAGRDHREDRPPSASHSEGAAAAICATSDGGRSCTGREVGPWRADEEEEIRHLCICVDLTDAQRSLPARRAGAVPRQNRHSRVSLTVHAE